MKLQERETQIQEDIVEYVLSLNRGTLISI